MISAVRTNKKWGKIRSGFTLLEIVVVLTLAAVITGGAVGLMAYSSDERNLRDASSEIELLAKRARTKAVLDQTPYAIEFREGLVRLMPYAMAGKPLHETSGMLPTNHVFNVPADMQVSILRWNTGEAWLPSKGNSIQIWRFDPEGLSEPLGVRFKINQSWEEDIYHPLTAAIQSTQTEIR